MVQGLSWKVYEYLAGQETPYFYQTWSFIAVFIKTHYWILSWFSWIRAIASNSKILLLLKTHFCIIIPFTSSLLNWLSSFPQCSPTKILYALQAKYNIQRFLLITSLVPIVLMQLLFAWFRIIYECQDDRCCNV